MSDVELFQKISTGDYVVPIKDACKHDGKYSESYPIGYNILDEAMRVDENDNGGVRDGDLIVVTGISGEGKTTFLQNIAVNYNKIGMSSLFFSFEVMVDNLFAKFKTMGLEDDNIIFTPKNIITGNLKWVKEKIIESKNKNFTKFIFIDHIDFLSPSNNRSDDQLRNTLNNITQELKTIALQEEVIIFLISHVKKVQGREVEMQDIAESGGIYKLADYVFSVARNYKEDDYGVKVSTNEGIIRFLKNRLTGKKNYMKFYLDDKNRIQPW